MTLKRVFFAVVFLALTVSAVNAYTVVMRDGRRVEIPNEFTVTNSTLTYAVSNGFQVTIQLNTVDIAATERANGERTGALLQRSGAPVTVPNAPQTRARRSITNQDLEVYRKARVENERAYEEQRKELGLPSAEERRREVAEIEDRTLEQVRSMRAQEEAYWRSRAEALRAEAGANEGRLGSIRAEIPWSYSSFGGFTPFDGLGVGVEGRFGRFRRLSSPFDGFLATPITPFPTFRNARRPVFRAPGVHINRPSNVRRGSRR
ncbi:MAG TPA: hypothetical protein VKB05_04780 [Pyrinomonadaceae bacterium]|nr:hypothetical protein [Pyrinomonadaceae bacterium]